MMNDKLEKMWKRADVTYFKAPSRNDPALKKRNMRSNQIKEQIFG
jgi:hypothetical protein